MVLRSAGMVLVALATLALGAAEAPDAGADAGVQHQANARQADAMIVEAEAAEAAGEFAKAENLFERAVLISGHDQRAHRGLERVRLAIAGGEPGHADLGIAADVKRDLAEVEVRVALKRAEMLAAKGRFEEAREALGTARGAIRDYPDLHAAERFDEVQELVDRFHAAALDQRRQDGVAGRIEAQQEAMLESEVEAELERSRFEARLARIISLKQRAHYELALSMARRLVTDYPDSRQAETLFGELLALAHEQRRLSTKERLAELKTEVSERIRRSMIPEGFDGAPRFPADWHDKQALRVSIFEEAAQVPEWELELRNLLSARVDVSFQELEVAQAFESIASRHGINMVIDPELRAGGGAPVSLDVRGMRLDNVFGWLARQAGTSWALRNEAVWVGGEAATEPVVAAYDATEFVYRPTDFDSLSVAMFSSGDAGSFDLFGGADAFGEESEGISPDELVDLIMIAVAPEVWDNPDYGIQIRNNWLIVSAPTSVHALVREFMRSQALANSVVVRIGIDWLEINDDFIEEIGVDWSGLQASTIVSPITAGILDIKAERSYSGSVTNALPASAVNLGQASVGSGLHLHWASIALPAINAILRAQEKKQKARVLDGIELTSLNGVESSATFIEQIAYISDYEVAAGGNLDPVIDVINVGQSIAIRPHVSADRKYVTLDLRPTIASATFFTENIVAQRIFGRGAGTGGVVFTNNFPLDLPNVLVKSAGTRVMIPDQGTVLVGGFGRNIEQSSETQVPILGHIPFLGRLFGMRGRYSSKSQLYLSVSARIILYEEEEANL